MSLTTRQKFERWAKRRGLALRRVPFVTRNGPRWYYVGETETAWQAWSASRRATANGPSGPK